MEKRQYVFTYNKYYISLEFCLFIYYFDNFFKSKNGKTKIEIDEVE